MSNISNSARSQVYMGIELCAVALDLADKLLDDPTGTDWFAVAESMQEGWEGTMDYQMMVDFEPNLLQFLRENLVYWNEAMIDARR